MCVAIDNQAEIPPLDLLDLHPDAMVNDELGANVQCFLWDRIDRFAIDCQARDETGYPYIENLRHGV